MLFNKKEPSFIVCLSWLATFAHVCVYIGTYGHVHHQCVFWYFPEAPILLSVLSFKIILNNNNYVFYKLDFNAVSRVKPRHCNIIQLWSYLTNSHVHLFHNGTIGKQRLGQEQWWLYFFHFQNVNKALFLQTSFMLFIHYWRKPQPLDLPITTSSITSARVLCPMTY